MLQSGSITGGEPGSCTSRKIVGQRSTVNLNWNPGTLTCMNWKHPRTELRHNARATLTSALTGTRQPNYQLPSNLLQSVPRIGTKVAPLRQVLKKGIPPSAAIDSFAVDVIPPPVEFFGVILDGEEHDDGRKSQPARESCR